MNRFGVLLVAATVVSLASALDGQPKGEIGMTGGFIGDGPWSKVTGRWLLLGDRDDDFELREVVVTTTRITSVCGGVGFSVESPGEKPGMLLIRGVPSLTPGPVVTAFHGIKFLLPGDSLHIPLGSDHWNLHAFGNVRPSTTSGGLGEPEFIDYQIQMTRLRMMPVFSIPRVDVDVPPYILWAGDLDADKVPDIFYSHSRRYALLLSSLGRDGQFLAEAGAFQTMPC
jgi:hypothetical protein